MTMTLTDLDISMCRSRLESNGISNSSNAEIAYEFIRNHRNELLVNCDWEITKALETGSDATALKEYRQALRDLPSTASPSLDEEKNLTGVTWPEKPQN